MRHQLLCGGTFFDLALDRLTPFGNRRVQSIQQLHQIVPASAGPRRQPNDSSCWPSRSRHNFFLHIQCRSWPGDERNVPGDGRFSMVRTPSVNPLCAGAGCLPYRTETDGRGNGGNTVVRPAVGNADKMFHLQIPKPTGFSIVRQLREASAIVRPGGQTKCLHQLPANEL